MALHLYVNGAVVHDEGEVDPKTHAVTRQGTGMPVAFATQAEGEAFADALCAKVAARLRPLGRRPMAPTRDKYVVRDPVAQAEPEPEAPPPEPTTRPGKRPAEP